MSLPEMRLCINWDTNEGEKLFSRFPKFAYHSMRETKLFELLLHRNLICLV